MRVPRAGSGRGSLEDRHALHMGGVREHVHRTGRHAAVARHMHQQAGITRQRGRVAADVDDAPRRRPVRPELRLQIRVSPPANGAQGEWKTAASDGGLEARFETSDGKLFGFALMGAATSQRAVLTKELPEIGRAHV